MDFLMESNVTLEYSVDLSLFSRLLDDFSQVSISSHYELDQLVNNLSASDQYYNESSLNSSWPSPGGSKTGQLLNVSTVIRIILYSVIFVACLIGNIAALMTLMSSNRMRNITNCFLMNLAISDLLLGIFCVPFTLTGSILKNFIFGPIMCKIIPYFQALSVGVTAWTLVAISLERYFAICQPLESRSWQTMSHSYRVIAAIWTANLLLMSPIAALSQLIALQTPGKHKCREVWPNELSERLFNLVLFAVLLAIPFVILVTTYSLISRELYGTSIFQTKDNITPKIAVNNRSYDSESNGLSSLSTNSHSIGVSYDCKNGLIKGITNPLEVSHNRSKILVDSDHNNTVLVKKLRLANTRRVCKQTVSKKRIVRMLCVLVIEFFICWTPIYVINVLALFWPKSIYSWVSPTAVSYIHLLSYVSSCTNPITYCFMHKKFREALMMMFRNRGSVHRYVITELDQSISNQSHSSTGCSGQTASASGSQSTTCLQLSQYNNRIGSQLMSTFQTKNSLIL